MSYCPLDDSYISGKGACEGCPHFDFDDQDDGENGTVYVPICTYKKETETEEEEEC